MTKKNTISAKKKKNLSCIDRATICNNSVSQMRSVMFAPVLKDKQSNAYKEFLKNDLIVKIQNGDDILQVRNRFLTQLHRDVLDLMLINANKKMFKGNECVIAEFTDYEILKQLGHINKRNTKWLRNIIRELQDINIILENAEKEISFHILNGYGISKKTGKHAVMFDDSYIKYFYTKDVGVGYKHLIGDIIALDSPILKAIVRFVISNSFDEFKMSLVKILENIGINRENTNERQYRRFIKTVKDNKAILKEKFDIILTDNNVIEYKYKKDISFYSINKEQADGVLPELIKNTEKEKQEYLKLQLKRLNIQLEGLINECNDSNILDMNQILDEADIIKARIKILSNEMTNNDTENQ